MTNHSRIHWLVAVGAVAAMVASAIHLTGLSILTPFVTGDLGFETGPFQLYYSLLSIATMLTMPVAGRLIDTLGARRLLAIGGIAAAIGLVIMSASSHLWQFYLAGVLVGLGVGLSCLFVPAVLVTSWFEAKRGAVMGVVMAGSGIGGVAMSQVIPRIVGEDGSGWRTAFIFLAAIMVAFTVGPALLLVRNRPSDLGLLPYGAELAPADHDEAPAAPGMTYRQALRNPWFYLMYIMLTILGLTTSIYQSLSVHLRLIGLTTDQLGLYLSALTLGLVGAKIGLGALVDIVGLRVSMIITLGFYSVCALLMPSTGAGWLLVILMVGMAAGTANATVTPPIAGAITVGRREFPAIWGIGATAFSLGNALGTPLWGAMKDATGDFTLSFRIVPALVVFFTLGLFVAMARGQASWRTETSEG